MSEFSRTYVELAIVVAIDVDPDEYEMEFGESRSDLARKINAHDDKGEHLGEESLEAVEVVDYEWVEDADLIERYDSERHTFRLTFGGAS